MLMNLRHTKVWLTVAVLCIVSFFLLFLTPGSYASELVYTVQTGSFDNEATAQEEFDSLMHTLNREKADFLRIEKVGKYYAVRLGRFKERINTEKFLRDAKPFPGSASIIKAYIKDERIKKIHRVSLPVDRQDVKEQSAAGPAAEKKEPLMAVKADGRKKVNILVAANLESIEIDNLKPPPFLNRDIFSSGYSMPELTRKAEEEVLNKLELKATIIDGQDPLAIIGDEVLGVGGSVEELEVIAIRNNEVILSRGVSQYILRMQKE